MLRCAHYAAQLERQVVNLKDELVRTQEHERSAAARAIQAVVCTSSPSAFSHF